jgi:hypothetical protein
MSLVHEGAPCPRRTFDAARSRSSAAWYGLRLVRRIDGLGYTRWQVISVADR